MADNGIHTRHEKACRLDVATDARSPFVEVEGDYRSSDSRKNATDWIEHGFGAKWCAEAESEQSPTRLESSTHHLPGPTAVFGLIEPRDFRK